MRAFVLKTAAVFMLLSAIAFARKAVLDTPWYIIALPLYLAVAAHFWRSARRTKTLQSL